MSRPNALNVSSYFNGNTITSVVDKRLNTFPNYERLRRVGFE